MFTGHDIKDITISEGNEIEKNANIMSMSWSKWISAEGKKNQNAEMHCGFNDEKDNFFMNLI